jgi:hypothetical protein
MAAVAKSWRAALKPQGEQMTRDERSKKCARAMLRRLGQRREIWKQGRQKDLAADIVVVALEALGLWKETSPT